MSKLKIGNFVKVVDKYNEYGNEVTDIHYGKIRTISKGLVQLEGLGDSFHIKNITKWKPETNNYCWFANDEKEMPKFGQFLKMNGDKYVSNVSFINKGLENFEYKFCLPFDCKLPNF